MVGMIFMGLMKGEGRNVDEISSRVRNLDMGYHRVCFFPCIKVFFMPQYCFHFQRMMCW